MNRSNIACHHTAHERAGNVGRREVQISSARRAINDVTAPAVLRAIHEDGSVQFAGMVLQEDFRSVRRGGTLTAQTEAAPVARSRDARLLRERSQTDCA